MKSHKIAPSDFQEIILVLKKKKKKNFFFSYEEEGLGAINYHC